MSESTKPATGDDAVDTAATNDAQRLQQLMEDFKDHSELRNALARKLGSNIIL